MALQHSWEIQNIKILKKVHLFLSSVSINFRLQLAEVVLAQLTLPEGSGAEIEVRIVAAYSVQLLQGTRGVPKGLINCNIADFCVCF